jgi:hypothetical protein
LTALSNGINLSADDCFDQLGGVGNDGAGRQLNRDGGRRGSPVAEGQKNNFEL